MMLDESSEVFAIEAERMWNFDDVRGDIAVDNIIVAVGQCDGINSMYYLSHKLLPPILDKILPTPYDLILFTIILFLRTSCYPNFKNKLCVSNIFVFS